MLDFLLLTECGTFSRSFNFMVEIYNFLKDFSFWVSVRNFFNFNTIDTSRLILKTKDKTSSSSLGKKTDSTENKLILKDLREEQIIMQISLRLTVKYLVLLA